VFNTGADISCISSQTFHTLLLDLRPVRQPGPSPSWQVANGQNLHTLVVYIMTVQIRGHTINHPFQVIQGLSEGTIVGIDFIHKHKMTQDPRRRQFTWGSWPKWLNRQFLISKATSLKPGTNKAARVNLVTEGGCIPITRNDCLAFINTTEYPYLGGGPYWIQPDNLVLRGVTFLFGHLKPMARKIGS